MRADSKPAPNSKAISEKKNVQMYLVINAVDWKGRRWMGLHRWCQSPDRWDEIQRHWPLPQEGNRRSSKLTWPYPFPSTQRNNHKTISKLDETELSEAELPFLEWIIDPKRPCSSWLLGEQTGPSDLGEPSLTGSSSPICQSKINNFPHVPWHEESWVTLLWG